jgi:hypothetical protein
MKKKKPPKERNFLVPIMRLNCKPGPHKDKKKEAARMACRVKLRPGPDLVPAFLIRGMVLQLGMISPESV